MGIADEGNGMYRVQEVGYLEGGGVRGLLWEIVFVCVSSALLPEKIERNLNLCS